MRKEKGKIILFCCIEGAMKKWLIAVKIICRHDFSLQQHVIRNNSLGDVRNLSIPSMRHGTGETFQLLVFLIKLYVSNGAADIYFLRNFSDSTLIELSLKIGKLGITHGASAGAVAHMMALCWSVIQPILDSQLLAYAPQEVTFLSACSHIYNKVYRESVFLEFLQPSLRFGNIGTELKGFLEVSDGSLGEMLLFALAAHDDILDSQFLEKFLLLLDFFLQTGYLLVLLVNDIELATDVTLGNRAFDVVTAMDSEEEVVQRGLHVACIKGLDGIIILLVGLALFESGMNKLLVVIVLGETGNFGFDEDIFTPDGALEADPFERTAARKGDIGLTASKDSAAEIDFDIAEGKALALVDGNGPRQTQRELAESAKNRLFNLLFFLVEGILDIAPDFLLNIKLHSILGTDIDDGVLTILNIERETRDGAQSAIDPPFLLVVAHKEYLGAHLEFEFEWRGQVVLREIAFDGSVKDGSITIKLSQACAIDVIYGIATGGQRNGKRRVGGVNVGTHLAIEHLEVGSGDMRRTDVVQQVDKGRIVLAIHFGQFDAYQLEGGKDLGIEEELGMIERRKQLTVFLTNDRLKLIDITDEEELLAAKRLTHIAVVDAQHLVNKVNDVGAHHANLVDDNQFDLA